MKKLIAVILLMVNVMTVFTINVSAAGFNRGDINGDGVFSSRDVYEFTYGKDDIRKDVDEDGRIDDNDEMRLSYLAVNIDKAYSSVRAPRIFEKNAKLNGKIDAELESKFSFKHNVSGSQYHITVSIADLEGKKIDNYMHIIKFDPSQLTYKSSYDIALTDMRSNALIEDGVLLCINVPGGYNFNCELVRYDFEIKKGVKASDIKTPTIMLVEINEGTVSSMCIHSGGKASCTEKAVCEKCGEAYGDFLPHKGGKATCDRKAVCTVCLQEYGKTEPHRESDFDDVCDNCGMFFDVTQNGIQLTAMKIDDMLYVFTTAELKVGYNYLFVQYSYNPNDLKLVGDTSVEPGYVQLTLGEELESIKEDGVYIINQKVFSILKEDFELPEIIRAFAHYGEENVQAIDFAVVDTLNVNAEHKHIDKNMDGICDLCSKISEDAINHEHKDTDSDTFCDICGYHVYYFGDMNADGRVTAADARLALRISAKLEDLTDYALFIGDINKDNKLTAADARKILRISAKLE